MEESVSEYHRHLQIKALQLCFHTESSSLSESFCLGLNLQRNIFESSVQRTLMVEKFPSSDWKSLTVIRFVKYTKIPFYEVMLKVFGAAMLKMFEKWGAPYLALSG